MSVYEGYKKLLKECVEETKEFLIETFGKSINSFEYATIITLAIKLADMKMVSDELGE